MERPTRSDDCRRRLLSAWLLLSCAACGGGGGSESATGEGGTGNGPLAQWLTAVTSPERDSVGDYAGSGAQAPGVGGPLLSVDASAAAWIGGRVVLEIAADRPLSRVQVSAAGHTGHYSVPILPPTAELHLLLDLSDQWPAGLEQVELRVIGEGQAGLGPQVAVPLTAAPLSGGEVQAVLRWQGSADLDLEVIDPQGEVIHFADRASPSGGWLERDANPVCNPAAREETVRWVPGGAPAGAYLARVRRFESCDSAGGGFTLELTVDGVLQTYPGNVGAGQSSEFEPEVPELLLEAAFERD
jgi:hypothetical protein